MAYPTAKTPMERLHDEMRVELHSLLAKYLVGRVWTPELEQLFLQAVLRQAEMTFAIMFPNVDRS